MLCLLDCLALTCADGFVWDGLSCLLGVDVFLLFALLPVSPTPSATTVAEDCARLQLVGGKAVRPVLAEVRTEDGLLKPVSVGA